MPTMQQLVEVFVIVGTVAGSISATATALSQLSFLPTRTKMILEAIGLHTKRIVAALAKKRDHACPYCLGTALNFGLMTIKSQRLPLMLRLRSQVLCLKEAGLIV